MVRFERGCAERTIRHYRNKLPTRRHYIELVTRFILTCRNKNYILWRPSSAQKRAIFAGFQAREVMSRGFGMDARVTRPGMGSGQARPKSMHPLMNVEFGKSAQGVHRDLQGRRKRAVWLPICSVSSSGRFGRAREYRLCVGIQLKSAQCVH